MRTIISDIPSDGMSVYSNIKMWLALANGGEWTDTHIPRTERPVRFIFNPKRNGRAGWDRRDYGPEAHTSH